MLLQLNSIEIFFHRYLVPTRHAEESPHEYLTLLTSFYWALEEMCYPTVGSFNFHFLTFAYRHLPQQYVFSPSFVVACTHREGSVFYQYLDQHAILVDRQIVEAILPSLGPDEASQQLKYQLFTTLDWNEKGDLVENQAEFIPYPFLPFFFSFSLFLP